MGLDKGAARAKFSAEPDRYYKVKLFDEEGFKRKHCPNCGKFFWTLNEKQKVCPDPPCTAYGFIGNSPAGLKKVDYLKALKLIEKFFVKEGHTSYPSYPTVCRWFPGLYFNIASVIDVQRSVGGKTVFELPSNPMYVPQTCLRFNDIPNVGVSGRHTTSFIMLGQLAQHDLKNKQGYWKDECVDIDWRLMTKVFKIPEEEISFVEDVWVGPNAFGYSLEFFVRGLELGNAVFTEFVGTLDSYKTMEPKLIDMGAGHERFVWLSNATPTLYDCSYGPVMKALKKHAEYDPKLFSRYSKLAGTLNMDEVKNFENAKLAVAKELGVPLEKLKEETGQLEALYAIADHTKTLLYAITDGQLPSNVGGGYNLRVVLRRAQSFIDEYKFPISLFEVCKSHAKYLKKHEPRLVENLDGLKEILDVEEKRFKETRGRAVRIIEGLVERKVSLNTEKLTELYESHGVTPELVREVAAAKGVKVEIPGEFYVKVTEKHVIEKPAEEKKVDASGLSPTRLLFYEDRLMKEFSARVLKLIDGKWAVLDQTCFFGRTGGQEPDHGTIEGCRVHNVEKIGDVIVHQVESPTFQSGDMVKGKIDWPRREQIMRHHTATHLINGAARHVLGEHVWQCGAFKDIDKAHIDMTHHSAITEGQVEDIEKTANEIVKKGLMAKKHILPRTEAEQKFGFRIYQGGAIPNAELRILEIPGFDIEACGGTHEDSTSEVGEIMITRSDRIQDGVVRLTYVAGPAAEKEKAKIGSILAECEKVLGVPRQSLLKEAEKTFEKWKAARKKAEASAEKRSESLAKRLEPKITKGFLAAKIDNADMKVLQEISKQLSRDDRVLVLIGARDKAYVFVSSGPDTKINAGRLASEICSDLGGNGGGTTAIGQGAGPLTEKAGFIAEELMKKYGQAGKGG
jgi:alanyl-tRNA synthetase